MPQTVIEVGEKLHIITRGNFKDDTRRHFSGSVLAVSGGQVRVQGYAFIYDWIQFKYLRKPEIRTRIFGISDAQLIIFVLPPEIAISNLKYEVSTEIGKFSLIDGSGFSLSLDEFHN